MILNQFTYDCYEKFLELILDKGYKITNYHKYKDVHMPCIIRHDVDFDLVKAAEFAERESNMCNGKIRSTYFILMNSELYNVFSFKNSKCIERILACGHEIGLHFDETKYKGDIKTITEHIEQEAHILEKAVKSQIRSVSMHMPSQWILSENLQIEGLINSYGDEFFNEFKYFSDSGMCWRENVEELIQREHYEKLHILTHPFWYSDYKETEKSKLVNYIFAKSLEVFNIVENIAAKKITDL